MELTAGVGQVSFQPVGCSRPYSDCRGAKLGPPADRDNKISYLDFSSNLKGKQIWSTDKIKRAVVTYRLQITVLEKTVFMISGLAKLLVPNQIIIQQTMKVEPTEESRNQRKSIKQKALDYLNGELEGGFEAVWEISYLTEVACLWMNVEDRKV